MNVNASPSEPSSLDKINAWTDRVDRVLSRLPRPLRPLGRLILVSGTRHPLTCASCPATSRTSGPPVIATSRWPHSGGWIHDTGVDLCPACQQTKATIATYDRSAAVWAAERNTPDYWAHEARQLQSFHGTDGERRLLDIGCGAGKDIPLLTSLGYTVTGVDLSAGQLDVARQHHPRTPFELASMLDLPFPDETFHAAWMVASLLHLPKAQAPLAIREARRILKPGGVIFITVKEGTGDMIPVTTRIGSRSYSYWTHDELTGLLEEDGLAILDQASRNEDDVTWVSVWARRPHDR